jgi:hypothetical protein
MIDVNTFGDSTIYKSLPHLVDEINQLSEFERKKISSMIVRKVTIIKKCVEETKSASVMNLLHRQLRSDILHDIPAMTITSNDVKTLAINFLLTKLKVELLRLFER